MKIHTFALIFAFCSALCFCDKISFSADFMKGSASAKNDKTILERNAHIKTESFDIYAYRIELEGTNYRYVTATGSVRGKSINSGLDFSCDKLFFDRKTNLVYFEGKVAVRDDANNVDATSQLMEYDMNTEIATLQVNVKLNQNQSRGTSSLAVYKIKVCMYSLVSSSIEFNFKFRIRREIHSKCLEHSAYSAH